jgi:hypothetical protein
MSKIIYHHPVYNSGHRKDSIGITYLHEKLFHIFLQYDDYIQSLIPPSHEDYDEDGVCYEDQMFISKLDDKIFCFSVGVQNKITIGNTQYDINFADDCFTITLEKPCDNPLAQLGNVIDELKRLLNISPETCWIIEKRQVIIKPGEYISNDEYERNMTMIHSAKKIQKIWRQYRLAKLIQPIWREKYYTPGNIGAKNAHTHFKTLSME